MGSQNFREFDRKDRCKGKKGKSLSIENCGQRDAAINLEHLIKETENQDIIEISVWNQKFNEWKKGDGDKPGPHPDPNHCWNKCPEIFDIEDSALMSLKTF